MIKINLTEEKIQKMKDIFRKWFFKAQMLNEFSKIIENDLALQKIIFRNSNAQEHIDKLIKINYKVSREKNVGFECQEILEDFFFTRFEYNQETQSYCSEYVQETKDILSEETIEFFKNKYKNFRKSQGAQIVRALDIYVCPYCNRNYLEIYNCRDKNKKIHSYFKGELDHYYSKSIYPHLALCIFNLIPSCKICNHEKLDKNVQVIYPYRYEDDICCKFELSTLTKDDDIDIVFEHKIKDIDKRINDFTYLQGISDNFKIELKPMDNKFENLVNNSIDSFRLNKKYNNSKGYIKELLRKRYIYNDTYSRNIHKTFFQIFKSPDDVKKTLFSNELDGSDFCSRPLSKLTYDILNEINYEASNSKINAASEKVDLLIKQLKKKLGVIPDEYIGKINQLDEEVIEKIALEIFEINTIVDLDNILNSI